MPFEFTTLDRRAPINHPLPGAANEADEGTGEGNG